MEQRAKVMKKAEVVRIAKKAKESLKKKLEKNECISFNLCF